MIATATEPEERKHSHPLASEVLTDALYNAVWSAVAGSKAASCPEVRLNVIASPPWADDEAMTI